MNEEQLLDGENIDNLDLESMDINDVLNEDSSTEEEDGLVNLEDLAADGALGSDDINLPDELVDIIQPENDNLDDILASEEVQEDVPETVEEIDEPTMDTVEESAEDLETIPDLESEESTEEPISEDELPAVEEELNEVAEEETDLSCEDECVAGEENLDTLEDVQEEVEEPIVEEEIQNEIEEPVAEEAVEDTNDEIVEEVPQELEELTQESSENDEFITNNLNDIKIEFGIEARGFILSTTMMEVMINKGYIFKDMLDNKTFDAVMIFNGNLDNTVMTNDIKIKIEDGKIQLIKG